MQQSMRQPHLEKSDDGWGRWRWRRYRKRRDKHIMLEIDGTWQAAYSDVFQSNVFRLNLSLNYRDYIIGGTSQIFIYSSGLGTATNGGKFLAGALGDGLDQSIKLAYINLVSNYVPGDRIYLFESLAVLLRHAR